MSGTELATLRLAFGYHFTRLILESDRAITLTETDFLERHFARDRIQAAGFVDDVGAFTQAHTDAVREAMRVLPEALSESEKLALMGVLLEASLADDRFERDEGGIIEQAAGFLRITDDALDAWLSAQSVVGEVDLPDPE